MPIHDCTQVSAGIFHDFHQDWTIEIRRRMNRGILPPGYYAMADQRVSGPEPDIIAHRLRSPEPTGVGRRGDAAPPQTGGLLERRHRRPVLPLVEQAGSKPRRPSTPGKPTASRSATHSSASWR